jgi:Zn-dependent protease with chaperone function
MLNGHYFDGRSPAQKTAQLWFDDSDAQFVVLKTMGATPDSSALDAHQRRYPVRSINFGEPTKSGQRVIRFDDGGQFIADNAQQAQVYLQTHQHGGGWVAGITLKWPWVAAAFVGTVAAVAVFYTHGIPVLARLTAPLVPVSVSKTLGDQAFEQLEKTQFKPSNLPQAQQAAIRQRWAAFLAKQSAGTVIPQHTLYIRSMALHNTPNADDKDVPKNDTSSTAGMDAPSYQTAPHTDSEITGNSPKKPAAAGKSVKPHKPEKTIEIPNAMALPNGAIVLTDGLVKLLEDKPDAVMGVLAHELGHLQHRHSMRLLIEVSALSALSAIVLGDASGFITQAPLLLGALSYSREHESEADDSAILMMRAAGVPSSELAVFFERARGFVTAQIEGKPNTDKTNETNEAKKPSWDLKIPDWVSTHPSDAARIEKLRRKN